MDPQRWAQIEELFQRASECDPAQRARLLDESCAGDAELRSVVQSLLASGQEAASEMQAAVRSGVEALMFPLVGETISHYRILNGLGGGGMGSVYCAEDVRLGRRVAVKFVAEERNRDPTALARFEREARSACALEHPNICPIYEFGEHGGQPFLVMPLLDGETLRERLSCRGLEGAPLTLDKLLDLGLQIASALDVAHRHGIIHRDIKPANVFITAQGHAKILDFGLAKPFRGKVSADDTTQGLNPADDPPTRPLAASNYDSDLTCVSAAMGTAGYMSPEQVRGEQLDARSDIFSFGLLLYEMATGQRRLPECAKPEPPDAIRRPIPPPPRELHPLLPPRLQAIIRKALEEQPEARYQTAAEMHADLAAVKQAIADRSARRSRFTVTALVALLSVAAAVSWFVRRTSPDSLTADVSHRSHSGIGINHKSAVVLADFTNTTGDPIFNGTLQEGLSVQLEQSPFLHIISDRQIQQTLAMMGQPIDAKLTPNIARELCLRTGSAAVLDGFIAQIGTQYLLTLKAVDCMNGESLARSQAPAQDKNHVLEALGTAAFDLRQRLGESLTTAQQFDTPLEQATTPSLEALQSYSVGRRQMITKGADFADVPLFQRAIQIDPNFALAYAVLGETYSNLGEHRLAADNIRRAYELRQPVSQREKFYIESHYFDVASGDLEKARQVYDLWAKTYPNDLVPPVNSAQIDLQLGRYERALEQDQTALHLNPAYSLNYADLAADYVYLHRLNSAQAVVAEALAKNLDSTKLHTTLYQLAFLRKDAAEMQRQSAWAAGERGVEDVLLALEAETAAYGGRLMEARELSRRAIVAAQKAEERETAATYQAFAALRESLLGNGREARGQVVEALRLSQGRDVRAAASLALAFAGEFVQSQKLLTALATEFPEDTIVRFNYFPMISAQLALGNGHPREAIATSDIAVAYELGDPVEGILTTAMYPVFVRAQAYLGVGDGQRAATEFQKIIDHSGITRIRPIGSLAHLGLARAYAAQGETVRARAAYKEFLELWKSADPNIPILKQAKAEYAKLRDTDLNGGQGRNRTTDTRIFSPRSKTL